MTKEKINKIINLFLCPKTGQELIYDEKNNIILTKDKKITYKIINDIIMFEDEQNNKTTI